MADLKNNASSIYQSIVSLASGVISGTLKRLQDGDGSDTAFSLSETATKTHGDHETTGNETVGGNVEVNGTVTAGAFVGDGSGLTNLPSGGGQPTRAVNEYTSNHNMTPSDDVIILDGDFIVTLLAAGDYKNKVVTIKCYNTTTPNNVQTVNSEEIDRSAVEDTIADGEAVRYLSDGVGWHRIAKYA
jgi:hypothetical protein